MDGFSVIMVSPEGDEMWLREGPELGKGEVAVFPSRQAAKRQADFMKMGLEEGEDYESISIVSSATVPEGERIA